MGIRADRPKNAGLNVISNRVAYAARREAELMAQGKSYAEAWDVIKQETRAGTPEKETKQAKMRTQHDCI